MRVSAGAAAVAIIQLAACSSGGNNCPASAPRRVTLCLGSPDFVAYRDGDGPWQTPLASQQGQYDFCVADDYQVVSVTTQIDGAKYAYESSSTADEAPTQTCSDQLFNGPRVQVTGHLAQPGMAWMDAQGYGGTYPQGFSLTVAPGTHDFVATSDTIASTGGGRMLVRRKQKIAANTAEADVDFSVEGMPLVPIPLTVTGTAANEPVSTTVSFETSPNDLATVSNRDDGVADVVPSELLESGDQQYLEIEAGLRGASTLFTGSETSFNLLPALNGIVFSDAAGVTANWTSLPVPDFTQAYLQVAGTGTGGTTEVIQMASASRGWLDKHSATSLTFDTSAPGYKLAWIVDATKQHRSDFSISRDTDNSSLWTGATDQSTATVNARIEQCSSITTSLANAFASPPVTFRIVPNRLHARSTPCRAWP